MAAELSHAGMELLGRYQVGELLSRGTLCRVYHGQDTVLRRPVIVKAAPRALIDAYRQALRVTAAFTHPAVVVTYDAVEERGHLFLVQEHVQARPLAAYARDGIPSQRAVDLAAQITRALAYAHAHGVIHGDLTPSAILIDRRATVRINNFGLPPDELYFAGQKQAVRDALFAPDGDIIDLDAPTVARSSREVMTNEPTAVGDVRAVGLLLWQVLSEQTRTELDGAPARRFRRDVPHALRQVVLRSVLDDLPDHMTDAETLLAELDAIALTLADESRVSKELTPPSLRVAREALAREAAWSVEETLGALRQWPVRPGSGSVSASGPTVADPLPSGTDAWPLTHATPKIGQPRMNLPSRPLGVRSRPTDRPVRLAAPNSRLSMRRSEPAGGFLRAQIGGVSVGRLLVYGLVLFVLFFVLGFFGPDILKTP